MTPSVTVPSKTELETLYMRGAPCKQMAGSKGGPRSRLADVRLVKPTLLVLSSLAHFSDVPTGHFTNFWFCFLVLKEAAVFCPFYAAELVSEACHGFDMCKLEATKPALNNLGAIPNDFKA